MPIHPAPAGPMPESPIAEPLLPVEMTGPLPSPSGLALSIMSLCQREDASPVQLADLVQRDPALSGRLLQQANAAALGARPVVSVHSAVLRLGMQTVRHLALGFSLVDQHNQGACANFDYPRFWSHSLLVAVAARALARLVHVANPDELFACGLLAQIGRLGLASAYPHIYSELLVESVAGRPLIERERERLHIDHEVMTNTLLRQWGLPSSLTEPLRFLEHPEAASFIHGSRPGQITQAMHLAWCVADLGWTPPSERLAALDALLVKAGRLGIARAEFGEVVDASLGQWRELALVYQLTANDVPSYTQLLSHDEDTPAALDVPGSDVVLLSDDESLRRVLQETMDDIAEPGHSAPRVRLLSHQQAAVQTAMREQVAWLAVDMRTAAADALALLASLRSTNGARDTLLLAIINPASETDLIAALDAGADDTLEWPVAGAVLRARLRATERYANMRRDWRRDRAQLREAAADLAVSNRRLQQAALTDELTELPNRRAGQLSLNQSWSAATRYGSRLTVMVIDIDNFKLINDHYGHAIGDRVLREVSQVLRNTARREDNVSRWGGEEFLLVSHNVQTQDALHSAERMRRAVRDLRIEVAGAVLEVTISIGVAARRADTPDTEALLHAADQALYSAKRAGRNRVVMGVVTALAARADDADPAD